LIKSKDIGWIAIHWIKFCPVDNSHDFFALPLLQQSRPKIKKGLLSSATFQVIFHISSYFSHSSIYLLRSANDI